MGSFTCNPNVSLCIEKWEGPNSGITSFDNIGLAMLTVFQVRYNKLISHNFFISNCFYTFSVCYNGRLDPYFILGKSHLENLAANYLLGKILEQFYQFQVISSLMWIFFGKCLYYLKTLNINSSSPFCFIRKMSKVFDAAETYSVPNLNRSFLKRFWVLFWS